MDGLNENLTLTGFFQKDNIPYFADKRNLYTWNEEKHIWEKLIPAYNKYGYQ